MHSTLTHDRTNGSEVRLRAGSPTDVDACARICYDAFVGINQRHGFPPDFPAPEVAEGLMRMLLGSPHVYGVVAEGGGRVVGSCFLWEADAIAGVGPITVDPSAQGGSI